MELTRDKKLEAVKRGTRKALDTSGYGGWVSDEQVATFAESILQELETAEFDPSS